MPRATCNPHWSWTELRTPADMFLKINVDLPYVELLAQLFGLLLDNRKGLVVVHRHPTPPPPSEPVVVYGDGYVPRCHPNVNMKFVLIDQT